jgi:hypothetical protein
MKSSLGYQLYACGKKGLPEQITFSSKTYRLSEVLKHDFFAATGLYELSRRTHPKTPTPSRIVLKMGRRQHFLGMPLLWLGRLLSQHEVSILRRLSHLRGTPRFLSCYNDTGLIYEYIEGRSLNGKKKLPDNFFDELFKLLQQIHQRNIAYLDMNKHDNILLGSDKLPHLIDFQISLHIDEYLLFSRRLSTRLRDTLQKADIYHLFKHKRHLCPDSLKPQEKAFFHGTGTLIQLHRLAATPLRKWRRNLLKFLRDKGLWKPEENTRHSRENNPTPFTD